MKWNDKAIPIIFIFAALCMLGLSIYVASQRDLTSLENTLLQVISLASGVFGSFQFGKQSAREAAKDMIKPHARSAFRRLVSLYESLSRVAYEINNSNQLASPEITIAKLEAIVAEQIATADDALEDWSDIVPEEVAELKERWIGSRKNGIKNDG
jgi:hypothetical protein